MGKVVEAPRDLEALDKEAAKENDEEWEPERQQLLTRRQEITKDEAASALERLLSKAEQYTKFLDRKLMHPGTETANSTSSKRQKTSTAAKEDKADEEVIHQPKLLTGGKLRPYQVQGYEWLVGLYENGLHGILADEMGLGKTVQTIALIAHLWEKGVRGPFLIVAPLSTVSNWVKEVERWAPSLPVLLYHGTKLEREDLRADIQALKKTRKTKKTKKMAKANTKTSEAREEEQGKKRSLEEMMDSDVARGGVPITVTTYDIVCRDRKVLESFGFKYIIVDEGHRLKNFQCRLIKELNQLCGGSVLRGGANKLLLTGTPLQNNLSELWSLLNFLMPEIFDDLDFFQSVFAFDSIGASKSQDEQLIQKEAEENIVSKLHKILRPFMMRRLKRDVERNLPKKKEVVLYLPMAQQQKEMYQSIVRGELQALLDSVSESSGRKTANKTQLNNVLMQLRKCCLHPFLHFEPSDASGSLKTDQRLVEWSGKLKVLDRMLTRLRAEGHKVLVFSQFTSMLDILQDYFEVLRPQWKFYRIDGATKLTERKEQMDEFNSDPESFCFMLSTRAGGVGINLMAADTVVIFDSDWNPHQDSQAQDRAHRIGQKNDVMVYRLVTAKSVELKILERANSKRKLERVVCAKHAFANTSHASSKTTPALKVEELRELLRDDFTGHAAEVGELDETTLDLLLDREKLFSEQIPSKGVGYEIVEHKASSIVGAVNDQS